MICCQASTYLAVLDVGRRVHLLQELVQERVSLAPDLGLLVLQHIEEAVEKSEEVLDDVDIRNRVKNGNPGNQKLTGCGVFDANSILQ